MPEEKIDKLEMHLDSLSTRVGKLTEEMAVMNVHLKYIKDSDQKRKESGSTLLMVTIGAIVSMVVTWVIGGGMSGE